MVRWLSAESNALEFVGLANAAPIVRVLRTIMLKAVINVIFIDKYLEIPVIRLYRPFHFKMEYL
ncbi:hypothetical protein GCM10027050_15120 [Psychrosphaera aestuarii]